MVAFATQVKRRRGTTAQNDAFTGAEGEIVVDTEKHTLRVHDGRTQGGFEMMSREGLSDKADVAYVNEQLAAKANADLSNMNASQSAKDTIVGWGMPDYSAGVDITWTNETKNITIPSGTVVSSQAYFIAPSDGMVVLHASVSNGAEIVFVNENIVESPSTNVWVNTRFPVSKGDEIRVCLVGRYYNCQFFPFKGVN